MVFSWFIYNLSDRRCPSIRRSIPKNKTKKAHQSSNIQPTPTRMSERERGKRKRLGMIIIQDTNARPNRPLQEKKGYQQRPHSHTQPPITENARAQVIFSCSPQHYNIGSKTKFNPSKCIHCYIRVPLAGVLVLFKCPPLAFHLRSVLIVFSHSSCSPCSRKSSNMSSKEMRSLRPALVSDMWVFK